MEVDFDGGEDVEEAVVEEGHIAAQIFGEGMTDTRQEGGVVVVAGGVGKHLVARDGHETGIVIVDLFDNVAGGLEHGMAVEGEEVVSIGRRKAEREMAVDLVHLVPTVTPIEEKQLVVIDERVAELTLASIDVDEEVEELGGVVEVVPQRTWRERREGGDELGEGEIVVAPKTQVVALIEVVGKEIVGDAGTPEDEGGVVGCEGYLTNVVGGVFFHL